MKFSDKLKQARSSKAISQEQLAELLGVSRQSVSKWENDEGYPEMKKVLVLSAILGVSIDWLFENEIISIKKEKFISIEECNTKMDALNLDNCQNIFDILDERYLSSEEKIKMELNRIVQAVADYYNIDKKLILSLHNDRENAQKRKIGIYLCKIMTNASFHEIGKVFRCQHAGSCMHSFNRIEELLETDLALKADIDNIVKRLSLE